jgi:hypothetical protein|nr:hypothetical protein [Kofleriaceae bacterium]
MKRPLPMLGNVEIASACPMKWTDMISTPDARVRACMACRKHVYNVSEMTALEVDRLIFTTEGRACVRYWQRSDGTILLGDCELRKRQATGAAAGVLGAVLAVAGAFTVYARAPELPGMRSGGELAGSIGSYDDPAIVRGRPAIRPGFGEPGSGVVGPEALHDVRAFGGALGAMAFEPSTYWEPGDAKPAEAPRPRPPGAAVGDDLLSTLTPPSLEHAHAASMPDRK